MAGKCDKMKNISTMMRVENTCVVRFRNEGEFKNPSRIYLSKNIVEKWMERNGDRARKGKKINGNVFKDCEDLNLFVNGI